MYDKTEFEETENLTASYLNGEEFTQEEKTVQLSWADQITSAKCKLEKKRNIDRIKKSRIRQRKATKKKTKTAKSIERKKLNQQLGEISAENSRIEDMVINGNAGENLASLLRLYSSNKSRIRLIRHEIKSL